MFKLKINSVRGFDIVNVTEQEEVVATVYEYDDAVIICAWLNTLANMQTAIDATPSEAEFLAQKA